jgi:hypothetical protein
MTSRTNPWDTRSTISKWAHVLERIGLALAGAACGLFVAAHVGRANIELIGSATTVLAIMLYGAAGFYLGIDLPPAPPDHRMHLPLRHGLGSRADAVELLSAAGTFLAAVAAIVSVISRWSQPVDATLYLQGKDGVWRWIRDFAEGLRQPRRRSYGTAGSAESL